MQNLIFRESSLNLRAAEKSAVNSAIAESRIPGGTTLKSGDGGVIRLMLAF